MTASDLLGDLATITTLGSIKVCLTLPLSVKLLRPLYAFQSTSPIFLMVRAFPLGRTMLKVKKAEMETLTRVGPWDSKSGMVFKIQYLTELLTMGSYILLHHRILCRYMCS
jgi:hypothetical protein